jgi:hypothetical protein
MLSSIAAERGAQISAAAPGTTSVIAEALRAREVAADVTLAMPGLLSLPSALDT